MNNHENFVNIEFRVSRLNHLAVPPISKQHVFVFKCYQTRNDDDSQLTGIDSQFTVAKGSRSRSSPAQSSASASAISIVLVIPFDLASIRQLGQPRIGIHERTMDWLTNQIDWIN